MKNKNNAITAGIAYTIGNYLIKGVSFLSLPLFSRILSTADYGIVNTYLAYESILMIFMGLAVHSSVKSAHYEFKGQIEGYISTVLRIPMIMLVLLLGIGNTFASYIGFDRLVICLLCLHAFSDAVVVIYNNKLSLEYQYKNYLIIAFINTFINIGLSVLLILFVFNKHKYLGRILGAVIPFVFISTIILIISMKCKPDKDKRRKYINFGMKYSLPTLPHGLSQIFLAQLDRIMIKSICGSSQAGIYSFAYNINSIIAVLITSLDTVWGPWVFSALDKKQHKRIKEVSTYYIYGMFVVISIAIFVSPEIVQIMSSKAFWDGRYVVMPVIASTFFTFLYTIPAQVQYYFKKTKTIAMVTVFSGILNVILNAVFIPKYGYVAAAYTTLFSYFIYFVLHYFAAWKNLRKFIFNNKLILGCIVYVFIWCLLGVNLVNQFMIRYLILIVFVILNLVIVLKKNNAVLEIISTLKVKE